MPSRLIILIILALLALLTCTVELPIAFTSSHSPHAFMFKAVIQPQSSFRLFSKKFRASSDYWTTVSTFEDKTSFDPKPSNEILFNDKHLGEYHIALYGKNDGTGSIH